MKKRILSSLLLLVLLIQLLPVYASAAEVTINIYNWGQYIADGTDDTIDVIAEFEKAYPNIKVNYMTFEDNESMYTKLKTGGSSFDLIIPSDYMVEMLIAEDMLVPLNFDNIPNFAKVDDAFKNPSYDPENLYSVPYTWGSVGVIYNSKYVDEADTGSWDLLWNEKYKGNILMFGNPRDAFAIAELSLGYSLNTEDPDELRASYEKLKAQKGCVQAYVMDEVFGKMERGEAWIAPYYAGDYMTMAEENPDLKFYFPEEGFNLFVDAMCIPKGCEHQKEAELFINFLCKPEICGGNLDYICYSAPISAAKEYIDESMAESDVVYPSEEIIARGQSFSALSPEATSDMNEFWLLVKISDKNTVTLLVLTIAAILLIIFLWLTFKVRKKKQKAKRCKIWKQSVA